MPVNNVDIQLVQVTEKHHREVADLIIRLLLELSPESDTELETMNLHAVAEDMVPALKIYAILAEKDGRYIGVITLQECAALYAGGSFGEISELYVDQDYRGQRVGKQLVAAAFSKADNLGWKRLEVCTPPANPGKNPIGFYESMGFVGIGSRLRKKC